jgi:hypothetical protein
MDVLILRFLLVIIFYQPQHFSGLSLKVHALARFFRKISVANPGCIFRIPGLNFAIPDPWSNRSRIRDPDPLQRI